MWPLVFSYLWGGWSPDEVRFPANPIVPWLANLRHTASFRPGDSGPRQNRQVGIVCRMSDTGEQRTALKGRHRPAQGNALVVLHKLGSVSRVQDEEPAVEKFPAGEQYSSPG